MDECNSQENFDNDCKTNNLSVQGSSGERDFDSKDLLPSSKQGKTVTERCVEWYQQQTKHPEEPPAEVMDLFRLEFKIMQTVLPQVLNLFFHDMAMTTAFVEFLAAMEEESRSK